MKFKLFKRAEIDPVKWDNCILRSAQSIVYASSWYLDVVSPFWEALIKENESEYVSVFPIPVKQRLRIKFIHRPLFTQQLGLFSLSASEEKRDLTEALVYIADNFSYVHYAFNTDNHKYLQAAEAFNYKSRVNYHLSLLPPYEIIAEKYSTNLRRNIKKGLKNNVAVFENGNLEQLINIFREGKGKELRDLKEKHFNFLRQVFIEAKDKAIFSLKFAKNEKQEIIAGALFLFFKTKIIYLFGGSTEEGKISGAVPLIFDQLIKENSGKNYTLDFEGSDIEGIANFYRGFGAEIFTYPAISKDQRPFFMKYLFK